MKTDVTPRLLSPGEKIYRQNQPSLKRLPLSGKCKTSDSLNAPPLRFTNDALEGAALLNGFRGNATLVSERCGIRMRAYIFSRRRAVKGARVP